VTPNLWRRSGRAGQYARQKPQASVFLGGGVLVLELGPRAAADTHPGASSGSGSLDAPYVTCGPSASSPGGPAGRVQARPGRRGLLELGRVVLVPEPAESAARAAQAPGRPGAPRRRAGSYVTRGQVPAGCGAGRAGLLERLELVRAALAAGLLEAAAPTLPRPGPAAPAPQRRAGSYVTAAPGPAAPPASGSSTAGRCPANRRRPAEEGRRPARTPERNTTNRPTRPTEHRSGITHADTLEGYQRPTRPVRHHGYAFTQVRKCVNAKTQMRIRAFDDLRKCVCTELQKWCAERARIND
jgi:hypothetical protein